MQTNVKTKGQGPTTHEGGPAKIINASQQLRRAVCSCLLWEDTFYESGITIAERIKTLCAEVSPIEVTALAVEARAEFKLRHVPLLLVRELIRRTASLDRNNRWMVSDTIQEVIQRADEMPELVSMFWADSGRKTGLTRQMKHGLAEAFKKFDAYQLGKYSRDKDVTLRDVMFLCHPRPETKGQADTWKKLADGTLESPDTWEVGLSAGKGKDKKGTWERLLKANKLGGMALIRNLRNMREAGVDNKLIDHALIHMKTDRILPFRFGTAALHAPEWESLLENAMFRACTHCERLPGKTILLVDVSGSMEGKLSGKSQVARWDAAGCLAAIVRELCEDVEIFGFTDDCLRVPARRGFALRDFFAKMRHWGTYLGRAIKETDSPAARMIIITDEQAHDRVEAPKQVEQTYLINVAGYKNGVGYGRKWVHLDGWSESLINYIVQYEKEVHDGRISASDLGSNGSLNDCTTT